jgi:hypothetical protein
VQHDHTQTLPENMPIEQLEVAPLGELRRQAALIAATADAALIRYTALRRCRRGTAPEPIEAAHATWRARYQLRDQVTAIIQKREREIGQGRIAATRSNQNEQATPLRVLRAPAGDAEHEQPVQGR